MATDGAPQSLGTRLWNATLYTIEVVTWPVAAFFGYHHHNLPFTTASVPSRLPEAARATCSNNIPEDSLAPPNSKVEQSSTSAPLNFFEDNMENPKDNASTSGGAAGGTDLLDLKKRVSYNTQTLKPGRPDGNKKSSVRNEAAQNSSSKSPSSGATHVAAEVEEARAMAALRDVVSLYEQLKLEWTKKPKNLQKCRELLDRLKVGLTSLMFLPTSNKTASQDELLIARDILEIGAQWSIEVKDIPSFERYMAQLKCYYLDYRDHLAESAYKYQLLGLNLLFLLSQNRVAEFHTELELLPSDQIQSNVYIRHPLSLEQYLMEGSYNKIFLAKGNVPADSYNFFMDILLDTIRNEIAACLEKAYEKISLKEATRMLNLPNQQAIKEYGAKKKWVLGPDNYYYFNTVEAKTENVLASTELAEQAINYARELEMIV